MLHLKNPFSRATSPGKTPESSAPPIICIGHSHSETVKAAAEAAGANVTVYNFWHTKDGLDSSSNLPRLAPWLAEKMCGPIFCLIAGAIYHEFALLQDARPFDVILPECPDLPLIKGAEILPYHAVRANIEARSQPFFAIMNSVREAADQAVFQMQSPPISANDSVPTDDPGWNMFFGPDRTIYPAFMRRKIWLIQSQVIAAHCRKSGIIYVPHPPQAIDENGFLRAGLNGTPGHANQAYGAMVLEQILQLARATQFDTREID